MVVFASLFIAEKTLSNLRHQGEQGESRPEFSPLGGEQFGESSISGVKKLGEPNTLVVDGEPPKLILLWNEYQMIGKKIYDNIFRRITDGKCPVSNCRFSISPISPPTQWSGSQQTGRCRTQARPSSSTCPTCTGRTTPTPPTGSG